MDKTRRPGICRSFLSLQQPDNYVAGAHALDAFEAGVALEGATVLIEHTGQGFGMLRIGKDGKQRGHIGLGSLETQAAVQLTDPDPGNGKLGSLCSY